jgi:hypothetical protein
MNTTHREIRARLRNMSPQRAIDYVSALELPGDEAFCIIECDVRGKSCVQVAARLYVSVDGLYKIRRRAYDKIADSLK